MNELEAIRTRVYGRDCETVYDKMNADRKKLISMVDELNDVLKESEPWLRMNRENMGRIPREGTGPTFFHTLSRKGDILIYQKIRRLHRKVCQILKK